MTTYKNDYTAAKFLLVEDFAAVYGNLSPFLSPFTVRTNILFFCVMR